MPASRKRLVLPLWGYLALNGAFALFLAMTWVLGTWFAEANVNGWELAGVFPVLVVCWLAFTVACIIDAIFDRFARERSKEKGTVAPPSNPSKEIIRKSD